MTARREFIAKPLSDYSALKARLEHWLTPHDARGRAAASLATPGCEACRVGTKSASAA